MNSNVLIGEIIFSVVRLVLLFGPLSESEWVGDEMGARDLLFPREYPFSSSAYRVTPAD